MSTACIVGHGPSLKKLRLGPKIDACDTVIRLKNCSMLLAEKARYGSRTDVMCSSTEVFRTLAKIKAKEYWGYPKKGKVVNQASVWWLERRVVVPWGAKVIIPTEVCNFWNSFFQEMGAKHPNVSTGMAAIVIALDRLKPKRLFLAGFDKVLNPETEGYKSTVPTEWNKDGNKDTGHDWAAERQLLDYLAAYYKETKIIDLSRNDVQP